MKQVISTQAAPSAPAFLSQAIASNGFIFVSGQVHNLPDNTLVGENTAEKLAQIMKNITAILAAADSTLDTVVKVTIYITDVAFLPELNQVYPLYFSDSFPAREVVCVQALPLGASIEVSVIAAR